MNHHFATMGDVWKHLPLAEILRLNPPRHYWETHAGSASYPLTESPSGLHGALRFLDNAPDEPALRNCAYLEALRATPGLYPGSPALATRALGGDASYIFCDIDPESAASLSGAVAGPDAPGLEARVIETDGVSAITQEAQRGRVDPAGVLVLVDPFDPHQRWTPGSRTPLELAGWLASAGFRVLFWYCYDSVERRAWARDAIAGLAPAVDLWCGDALMPIQYIYPDRSGPWGCGIVLANATSVEVDACQRLGHALERMSAGDPIQGNDPASLTFII
jgi:hypothetical protein